ncbi:hypothetical protein PIROE2DRAFT_12125 [Piromyces sp. E2]|nr:hypothetical protein PIROE2DRAFT_12125 [Piromyces sp. E2]|eukprot:OUM61771.1 hypothetical protein PIROE2DRAFT_12125 [Piromyces sp. E2]
MTGIKEELYLPKDCKALYPKDFYWKANPDKADELIIIYVVTDDGCICTIQFQYASSFIKSTSGIIAKFWNKNVNQSVTKTGKVSDITYSDDKRSIFLFDSSITAKSPDSLDFKIKVGCDPQKIQYDLDFTTTGPYGYQMEGDPPECMRSKDSEIMQNIISTAKVSGTAIINGTTININGNGLLYHNYSCNVKNSLQAMKRYE